MDDSTGRRDTAFLVMVSATAVGLVHAVDDAVVNRQPGVPAGQHLPALLVVVVLAGAAILWFRSARVGIRAALALVVGIFTFTNGVLHVIHIAIAGVSGSDVTGALAAAAGVVLICLGISLPFLRRGEGDRTRSRRWVNRLVAVLAAVVLVPTVVMPVAVAIVQTHKFRAPIESPPNGRYQSITFESSDGLRLAGWYHPSGNGAAVIIVNSARGDRNGSTEHAELLVSHGYGVLLYDARGSGASEGSPNAYGWEWERDVSGAIEFLQQQPDVDPERIGALGLSTGADVLIDVAANDRRLTAVVGDGATARSVADIPDEDWPTLPFFWPMTTAVRLFSGTEPGPPLEELAAEVAPTPLLLIAAGSLPGEISANRRYAAAANEPVELWELPDVNHTAAIREEPDEYERRVIDHFDQALLGAEPAA